MANTINTPHNIIQINSNKNSIFVYVSLSRDANLSQIVREGKLILLIDPSIQSMELNINISGYKDI